MVGAGGAGCAVAMELVLVGASVRVFDVSTARANALAERKQQTRYAVAAAEAADPRGTAGSQMYHHLACVNDDPLPVGPLLLSPETLLAEVVVKPLVTAFLRQVKARGCQAQLGEAVILYQLDAQDEFVRDGLA